MPRTKRYNLSLDDEEEKELQRLFNQYKSKGGTKRITAWIKEKTLNEGRVIIKPTTPNKELIRAIYELNKIGVNINQVVKKINNDKDNGHFLPELKSGITVINHAIQSLLNNVDRG